FNPPASTLREKALGESGNRKIDPALRQLVQDAQSKSLSAVAATAKAFEIPMEDDRIAVMATAESEDQVGDLRDRIRAAGGTVVAIMDEAVFARVPADAVNQVGAAQSLSYLGPQGMVTLPPDLGKAGTASADAGVLMTKANLLHAKGISGK